MPHCVIEYSAQAADCYPVADLIEAAQLAMIGSGLFGGDDVKTRSVRYDDFVTGNGAEAFAHLTIRILSGRTQQQRIALSECVVGRLSEQFPELEEITVEIREMERESYRKVQRPR